MTVQIKCYPESLVVSRTHFYLSFNRELELLPYTIWWKMQPPQKFHEHNYGNGCVMVCDLRMDVPSPQSFTKLCTKKSLRSLEVHPKAVWHRHLTFWISWYSLKSLKSFWHCQHMNFLTTPQPSCRFSVIKLYPTAWMLLIAVLGLTWCIVVQKFTNVTNNHCLSNKFSFI